MPKASKNDEAQISLVDVRTQTISFYVLGKTPLIYNAMSQKVRWELLLPKGRKTAAEKKVSLKHQPLEEYQSSMYQTKDFYSSETTLLQAPAVWFKHALCGIAVDIPGATKASLQRLTYVEGDSVEVYGVPEMFMGVVRNSDMNRTPDIRTRAILPEWACKVDVSYFQPQLNADVLGSLMGAAGLMGGVGDYRQSKGKGNYGQFTIVQPNDPRWTAIVNSQGADAQRHAFSEPAMYNQETAELYAMFQAEMAKRDPEPQAVAAE